MAASNKLAALRARRAGLVDDDDAVPSPTTPARARAPAKRVALPPKKPLPRSKRAAEAKNKVGKSNFDVDTTFASMLEHSRNETGLENAYTAADSEQLIIGLALPAFALRFLFQMDICPLSRIIQITGERGSAKSGLLYEIMRWTLAHGGMAALAENEGKDSPDLRASLMEHNQTWLRRLIVEECDALEDWQEAIQRYIEIADRKCGPTPKQLEAARRNKKRPPSNWVYPFCFGVDSFMATNARETARKINTKGSAERSWAIEANLIAKYARNLPGWIRGKPMLVVGTNHLKRGQDEAGRPKDNVPGGAAIGFYETLEIKMQRVRWEDKVTHGGIRVGLTTAKNSLGQSNRKIQAIMEWEHVPDPATGEPIQRTYWDWYAASIELLLGMKKHATLWDAINEVVDLHAVSGRRVWSKRLGIRPDKPVNYTKAGAMLEEQPDLMEPLYPILRIKRRTHFRPGEDYVLQGQQGARLKEDTTRIYQIHDLSSLSFIGRRLTRKRPSRNGDDSDDDADRDGEVDD